MMEKNLIERFKKLLDKSYDYYYGRYSKLMEMKTIKEEFRHVFRSIVRLEDILSLSSDDIIRYMKYFDMDATIKQIDTYKFILTEKMLSKSSRAVEPKNHFDKLARKIEREIMNGVRKSELVEYSKKIDLLQEYIGYVSGNNVFINDDKFDISELFEIFDFTFINDLTDAEKRSIIDVFIKSDLDMRKKENERLENDELEKAQELFDRGGNEIVIDSSEDVSKDEVVDLVEDASKDEIGDSVDDADVVVSDVNDDTFSYYEDDSYYDDKDSSIMYFDDEISIHINPLAKFNRDVLDSNIVSIINNDIAECKKLSNQYNPKEGYHYNAVLNLVNEKDVVERIEEYSSGNDFLLIYLLSVYACFLLRNLDKDLNDEYVDDNQLLHDFINEKIKNINYVLKRINLLKKKLDIVDSVKNNESNDSKKYTLIFVKNGDKSYFSKSIEAIDREEYKTVDKILGDLENGIIKGDKLINDYKSRLKNGVYILYQMYGKYIFVMGVFSINERISHDKVKYWSVENEKRIVNAGGQELEQLLMESSVERNMVNSDGLGLK